MKKLTNAISNAINKIKGCVFPHYVTTGHVMDINNNVLYIFTERGDVFPYKNTSNKEYWVGYYLPNVVVRVYKKGDFIASI